MTTQFLGCFVKPASKLMSGTTSGMNRARGSRVNTPLFTGYPAGFLRALLPAMTALLVSAALFSACDVGSVADKDKDTQSASQLDRRTELPKSYGKDEVKTKTAYLKSDDSPVTFFSDGQYQIAFKNGQTEKGAYSYNSTIKTVVLKSSQSTAALTAFEYKASAGLAAAEAAAEAAEKLMLTPVLFIEGADRILDGVELVSEEPSSYGKKGVVSHQDENIEPDYLYNQQSILLKGNFDSKTLQGDHWAIVKTYLDKKYQTAKVNFRLGGAYALWKDFSPLFYGSGTVPPPTPPTTTETPENVTALTCGVWTEGDITASGMKQWFSFTATADTHYIHINFGTLTDVYVKLYTASNQPVDYERNLYSSSGGSKSDCFSLTSGQTYYVRIKPYYTTRSGNYRITFTESAAAPEKLSTTPENVTALTSGVTAAGSLANGWKTQWFSFTATAAKQYFHITPGTLSNLYIQLYDSSNKAVSTESYIYSASGAMKTVSRTLTNGQTYYVRIRGGDFYAKGDYQILFDTSSGLGAFTINGFPGASGNVYACNYMPSTAAEVSSYCRAEGSLDSTGTVTWTTEPSMNDLYYIVVYTNDSYYRHPQTGFSSGATTLEWTGFNSTAIPTPLKNGEWKNGQIAKGEEKTYTIFMTAGCTYYIWWNDSAAGDNTKTCDIQVSGCTPPFIWSNDDEGWSGMRRVEVTAGSGELKLTVKGKTADEEGTYAIAYKGVFSSSPPKQPSRPN